MTTTLKTKFRLYKLLSQNKDFEAKRSPMFGQNRFAKIFSWIMATFWIGYLIVIGVMLHYMFKGIHPTMASYHMMNRGVVYLLTIDFLMRLATQHTPAQDIKPYSLMPIKRNDIIGCSIIHSMLSVKNLLWLFMIVPFAFVSIFPNEGITPTLGFCLGWWLVFIANSQFYIICRTLYTISIFYWAIPITILASFLCLTFIPEKDISGMIFQFVGKGFYTWNPIYIFISLAAIGLLSHLNLLLQKKIIYKELAKEQKAKIAKVSEYSWLNKFGEIGEYIKLDLKCSLRCKTIRLQNIYALVLSIMFTAIMSIEHMPSGFTSFYIVYAIEIWGIMGLVQILGIEGNYMDGLISRKESILSCIKAKYYITCIKTLIPFGLMLILVAFGRLDFYRLLSFTMIALGPVFALLCCNAIINKQSTPLFSKITGRGNKTSFIQFIFIAIAWGAPMLYDNIMRITLNNTKIEAGISCIIGFAVIFTNNIWTKAIYMQFCKRKYENMSGFRNSITNE